MTRKYFVITILGMILSFAGGFLLANGLNRSQVEEAQKQTLIPQNSDNSSQPNNDLTKEEIQQRIQQADQNPENFSFQKNLGIALYRYGVLKTDSNLLEESSRLLQRAHGIYPEDYDVLVTLGNLNFDLGYSTKNTEKLKNSREYYEKALKQRPSDIDVRTDYALTFFYDEPQQIEKTITELNKSFSANPKHEKTLQFLVQAFLKKGDKEEAEKKLAELKKINPNSPSLAEIESALSSADQTPVK